MVGIVIVSHSALLAAGVRELAEQMVQGRVPIATAGGIDDPENPIGTDALAVQAAIEQVYSDDGVVVLMDLGSALMSAELALELLDPAQQANVFLCAAPLVEGAMAAVVQASVGSTAQEVLAEAQSALAVKEGQLGSYAGVAETPAGETPTTSLAAPPAAKAITLQIRNRQGLHARPAALFVTTANQFQAEISVHKAGQQANAKSINQVATLGARQGDEVTVRASGPDAAAALAAIQALAEDDFGEKETAPPPVMEAPRPAAPAGGDNAWSGVAASPGVAVGPAALYRPQLPQVTRQHIDDPAGEWQRLQSALTTARQELVALQAQATRQIGAADAAIFAAHALILQDPELLANVQARISSDGINAEAAWHEAMNELAATYQALDDAYMQARAADVRDVARRVLGQLMAMEMPSLAFTRPVILVAADLTPSDTARLDPAQILGICTELGGATAHSAILARALGIPAVVGLGSQVWQLASGQTVGLDGSRGEVWPQPDDGQLAVLQARRVAWQEAQHAAQATGRGAAITQDGRQIEVAANIGGPRDVPVALDYGAEGVGLFRTEFLFMDRPAPPDEAEQLAAYREVAAAMAPRPVIIRTLDVGGDKPLPYLDLGREENPFLGYRGIRFCLHRPDIFKPQLRAILRASQGHNLRVMFPMIGTLAELRAARAMLAEAQAELRAENVPFDEGLAVGIMIEVPSAVATADQLAGEADFFSIGTNDLTQYVMAADRGNANVAGLANALQPAVLRMIQQTVRAAHAAGIWVGMCGELAGNALATPLLVGLGLDELSMSAPALPAVKAAVRGLTMAEASALAGQVLAQVSVDGVMALLGA